MRHSKELQLIYEQQIVEEGKFMNAVKSTALAGALAFGGSQAHASDQQPQQTAQVQQVKQLDPSMYQKWGVSDFEVISFKTKAEAEKAAEEYMINTRVSNHTQAMVCPVPATGSLQPLLNGEGFCVVEFPDFNTIRLGNVVVYSSRYKTKYSDKSGHTNIMHPIRAGNIRDGFKAQALTSPAGYYDPWDIITDKNFQGIVHKIFTWTDGNKHVPQTHKSLVW